MNERLKLISGNERLTLGPTDGPETLAGAADIFTYIDSNFEHRLLVKSSARQEQRRDRGNVHH
jgi:hypothetical protein